MSHVAFPADGTFQDSAECPETHSVSLPQLFLEVIWGTREFNEPELWPEDGSRPLVFSYGDMYVPSNPSRGNATN